MLAVLLALATTASAASPAPTPSTQPLKTIVTVHSSPFCTAFAHHVNAAISAATKNDASLGSIILTLRAQDIGGNGLQRRNELESLTTLADSMYREYRSGEAEVDRLRDLAKTLTDKNEQSELKASADALGGALYRQHLIQRDLDGFVAYLDAGEMRQFNEDDRALMNGPENAYIQSMLQANMPISMPLPGDETPQDDLRMAKQASHDFQKRVPDILTDEITAGGHIATVGERC